MVRFLLLDVGACSFQITVSSSAKVAVYFDRIKHLLPDEY